MPTITMPEFGIQGIPDGFKDNMRADFRADEFAKLIEVKGYRLAWQRASVCPCSGINEQTQQVDPNCPLCAGKSWLYFGPRNYVLDQDKVGQLTDAQKAAVGVGAIIKGIMTGLTTNAQPHNDVGRWMSGTSQVTVRPENRLGYYDKLVGLDSEIVYAENLTAGSSAQLLEARYPIVSVNYLRSLATIYTDQDFELQDGKVKWKPSRGPSSGTRLAIHYQTFPVWLIIEHPHTVRDTLVRRKTKVPTQPLGTPKQLPVQALVRYDFLQG